MMETTLSRGELILLVVCGVALGNLLTLLLIVGWRAFLHGRPPTFRSAPIWSSRGIAGRNTMLRSASRMAASS